MRSVSPRGLIRWVLLASLPMALATSRSTARAPVEAPLIFEANPDQGETSAAFLARGDGYEVGVDPTGVTLHFPPHAGGTEGSMRLFLIGAGPAASLAGTEELPGKVSYLVGSDPSSWRSGIPTYAAVAPADPYPGVSMTYRGDRRQLAIELTIAPGADPRSIRIGVAGTDLMRIDPATGDLILAARGAGLRLRKPDIANFVVRGDNEVGILPSSLGHDSPAIFRIRVDRPAIASVPSAADPVRIVSDSAGNSYVAGRVLATRSRPADAFVTKLGPDQTTRLYTTYFGGEGVDTPLGITVDSAGEVVVTGKTTSTAFPLVGALASVLRGGSDAFVAKLAADGASFVYSTYLGGDGDDEAHAVDVDGDGSVWITGRTSGVGFPTTEAAVQRKPGGLWDAFVVRLSPDGSRLAGSTLLGGRGDDSGNAIRVDRFGSVYVTGATKSADFPAVSAVQPKIGGGGTSAAGDAFVARLDSRAAAILFSTFLGGGGEDSATGLGLDRSGTAYVAGSTASTDFGAIAATGTGGRFVASLSPDGAGVRQLMRLDRSAVPGDEGFAVEETGNAWVAGGDGALASRIGPDGRVLDTIPGASARGATLVEDLALYPGGGAIVAGVTTDASASAPLPLETSPSGAQVFASRGPASQSAPASANCPGTISFSNGAGTGLWQTPANWNLNRLPTTTDDVCIPATFAVTLSSGTQTVNSLFVDSTGSLTISTGSLSVATTSQSNGSFTLQAGSTLTGAGDFTTTGSFSWTGGTVTGAGNLVANAGIAIGGAGTKTLTSSRVLTTNGMTTWTGTGGIGVGTGAVINNAGTWDCQSDATFSNGFGGTATFNNQSGATFQKSAGSGTTNVGITFNNSGTAAVQSGTINVSGGGTGAGSFTGTGGTTLQFGASYTLGASSIVVADGVVFSAGTVTDAGAYTAASTTINGATASFDSPSPELTTTLTISGGTLQGTGTLNVSGLTTWTGGTMTGAGTTNANGGLTVSGTGSKVLNASRILNVTGSATWTGSGGFSVGTGAAINNNGTWDCQSDASFSNGFGGTATFNNSVGAIFMKSAGTGTTGVAITFNNHGTVDVRSGTVNFSGGGTGATSFAGSASFTGSPSTTLQFSANYTLGATSSVAADGVLFSGGTTGIAGAYTAGSTTFNGGMASFDTPSPAQTTTLTLSAGSLQGTGTVNVSGLTTWTTGTMTAAGTTNANGGLTASGTGTKALTGSRTLNVAGSTTWTGTGGFSIGTGAVINNSGAWDCQSDASFTNGFGGTATFDNLLGATFKKSAGAGITAVAITFNNSGSVNVQSGTVNLSLGGTSSGSFTGSATTTLQFGGGTHALGTTSSVNAAAVAFAAGTVNVDGSYAAAAGTTVNGGIANFDAIGTVTSVGSALTISGGAANFISGEAINPVTLSMSGGTLQGTDTVTVSGQTTWTFGTMTGAATTNLNGGLSATGASGRSLTGSRILNVAGPTTWTGSGGFSVGTDAVINNSGTWDCQSDASFSNGVGGTATFNNVLGATFKKSAGSGTTGVAITFNNSGTADVQSGTVSLSGGGTSSGSFTGSAATTLQFAANYTLGASSSVAAGGVLFSGGTTGIAGAYTAGSTTINGGIASFDTPSPAQTTTLTLSNGTLQGTGMVNVSGLTSWTAGTMTAAGTTNANGGLIASGTGGKTLNASHSLNVAGLTTWTGTGGFSVGTGAVVNNSGTWDCQNDASFSNGFGGTATFNNLAPGTFKKSAGLGTTAVGIAFNNAGAVQALAATLQFTAGFTQTAGSTTLNGGTIASSTTMNIQGGTFTGMGTATANVSSSGQAIPGLPIGILTVSGSYTQSSSGALGVDIGGHTPGTQFDQLNLTGTGAASLAGTLNVSLANGFMPVGGDSFTIMNFISRAGTFTTLNVPALAQGCWLPVYNATSVVLQVWTTAQEITGVAVAPDKTTVSWSPLAPQSGPAATYDVMRGLTSELPVGGKPNETCLVSATTATSFPDATVPASDSGFYYLVRGTNACGKGDYGTTSSGAPRTATACP